MLFRCTLLALVVTGLVLVGPADAAVCFQLNANRFVVEVTTFGPGGFFSVAGEMVSALGRRYPVAGGGRLQADETALFGATAYFHERLTTCCEAYTLHFQGVLLPPAYDTGSVTLLSAGRELTGPNPDASWSASTASLTPAACP